MKPPSLDLQIAAVKDEIACVRRSYTHKWGKYKGKIPPGPNLRQITALREVVKSLRKLKRLKK